jgi:Rieske Fe-S protein
MSAMERRAFVRATAVSLVVGPLTACASVAMLPVEVREGAFRLDPRDHPRLAQPGGYLRIQPAGLPHPVLLLRGADGFVALSPICQHLGCTVNIEGALLLCPCHGSVYDREGRVLRGPTERALVRYPVTVLPGGELVIDLQRDGAEAGS